MGKRLMSKRWHNLKQAQHGQGTIEFLASLVFFCLLLVGFSSLSAYIYLEHGLVTAAREGARLAALSDGLSGSDVAGATGDVQQRVIAVMQASTGQILDAADITVIPPDSADPYGERMVRVRIDASMESPLSVGTIFQGFGATHSNWTLPLVAQATMRYEE